MWDVPTLALRVKKISKTANFNTIFNFLCMYTYREYVDDGPVYRW